MPRITWVGRRVRASQHLLRSVINPIQRSGTISKRSTRCTSCSIAWWFPLASGSTCDSCRMARGPTILNDMRTRSTDVQFLPCSCSVAAPATIPTPPDNRFEIQATIPSLSYCFLYSSCAFFISASCCSISAILSATLCDSSCPKSNIATSCSLITFVVSSFSASS